jgi:hypothetical protein
MRIVTYLPALLVYLLLLPSPGNSFAGDVHAASNSNDTIDNNLAAWLALPQKTPYELEALALDTNANINLRSEAIRLLSTDSASHLDMLEFLLRDPQRHVRFAAIEAIDPVKPDVAYRELKLLYRQMVQDPNSDPTIDLFIMSLGDQLARTGDGSAYPFIISQLMESKQYGRRSSAISSIGNFMYLPELKPYEPLVQFIDKTLSALNTHRGQEHDKNVRLIQKALYKCAGLHAVETIPDFKRWLDNPRTAPVRDTLEHNLRKLEQIQAGLDAGEPDKRYDPAFKRTPGTTPAWELPNATMRD